MPGPRLVRRTAAKTQATTEPISRDQIAQRAYELFQQEGEIHGRDLDHWLRAETELSDSASASAPPPQPPAPTTTRKRAPRISA